MTEPATPAAAPPATPAAAPTPAPTAEATPPAQPASLVPQAAPSLIPPAAPTAPDPNAPKWYWADGVEGQGARPAWYNHDKYKTIDQQAKAQVELEKRMGAFVGAPPDGKYERKLPDGLPFAIIEEHPLLKGFEDWAKASQLSQKGFNELLGMLAQYETAQIPDMGEIKKSLGPNADARIESIAKWGNANLSPENYQLLRAVTTTRDAADVLKLVEAVISKTQQPALPAPNVDTPPANTELQRIQAMQAEKDEKGRIKYFENAEHRRKVDQAYTEYYGRMSQQRPAA